MIGLYFLGSKSPEKLSEIGQVGCSNRKDRCFETQILRAAAGVRALVLGMIVVGLGVVAPSQRISAQELSRVLFEKESLYHYVRVVEEGDIRRLQFRRSGIDFEESAINVRNPLDFPLHYYKLMMAGFIHCPHPQRILFVGLGGGTLVRAIRHYYPDVHLDVIELDPVVVEAAQAYFGFKEDSRMKVYIRDARVQMTRLAKEGARYDMIFLDAFRGGYIPYHLTTREFMELVAKLLEEDGVVVSNLQPGFASYHYQRRTIARVFPSEWSYGRYGNVIVVASKKPQRLSREEIIKRAEQLQAEKKFTFFLPEVAQLGTSGEDYVRQGEILTDDYAPTDVLRSIPQD
ncbi:Spermidine synthase-like protein [Thermogutta terrifontis]|uniref:Spermidine synthase-like protein n=1 Tax=Thermogutta terrifontis TaxID=1331910 RepID=A0A286RJ06_9BACT|nr:fused MFS/spermidine synthase [Thermogutta terrifontis]ASV75951.1 Spermidine synthase-like protein [Thermogutta terrifontis]